MKVITPRAKSSEPSLVVQPFGCQFALKWTAMRMGNRSQARQ
jgi:hypothetical protein